MLYFYCAHESELLTITRRGIQSDVTPVRLWQSLTDARKHCSSRHILVIDGRALHSHALLQHQTNGERTTAVSSVPVTTIQNIEPYAQPEAVTAAGGYVIRAGAEEPELLTIFRRGVWDLPKGKVESDETPEAGALREVREEVGIDDLELLDQLGTTVHGYRRNGRYHVKTTYWYAMQTSATSFTPQREEQIKRVVYMRWSKAKMNLGYDTLRDHMEEIETQVWNLVE
jgi:ADP-ribose pyrophosphatase YjhB (NUDIX family)